MVTFFLRWNAALKNRGGGVLLQCAPPYSDHWVWASKANWSITISIKHNHNTATVVLLDKKHPLTWLSLPVFGQHLCPVRRLLSMTATFQQHSATLSWWRLPYQPFSVTGQSLKRAAGKCISSYWKCWVTPTVLSTRAISLLNSCVVYRKYV